MYSVYTACLLITFSTYDCTAHLRLFIQRHNQVVTVISKGFYNNIQCGWAIGISSVVDVKKIFLCYGAITSVVA